MGIYQDVGEILTTSAVNFSSDEFLWLCSGTAGTDIMATTSVGLNYVTTGMMIVFRQASGGTVAAGITSGSEYVVSTVTAASSSFQVYGQGQSSAVDITADSTGTDYAYHVIASSSVPTNGAKYALVQMTPTSGWQGQFYFVGTNQNPDFDARLTTSNPFTRLSYQDVTASSFPAIATTNVISSGQLTSSFNCYRVDVAGFDWFAIRRTFSSSGAIRATAKLYRE